MDIFSCMFLFSSVLEAKWVYIFQRQSRFFHDNNFGKVCVRPWWVIIYAWCCIWVEPQDTALGTWLHLLCGFWVMFAHCATFHTCHSSVCLFQDYAISSFQSARFTRAHNVIRVNIITSLMNITTVVTPLQRYLCFYFHLNMRLTIVFDVCCLSA